jgi:copper transport protein
MNHELVVFALGMNRVIAYAGYVLLAGIFAFWSLVWPEGRSDRKLVLLVVVGTGLLLVSTLAVPAIRMVLGGELTGDIFSPLGGAAMMVRLAALAATAFFLVDIIRRPVVGWRRVLVLGLVIVLAATLVVQSDALAEQSASLKIIATTGHVLATATWLGGLVALAAVLIRRDNLPELRRLIPRFSVIATVSIAVLVVTGLADALAAAGGLSSLVDSRYGLLVLVKAVIFTAMLVLGVQGRRYAARIAFRQLHHPAELVRESTGMRSLTVVLGAELAIAFVILSATSLLVLVAPH